MQMVVLALALKLPYCDLEALAGAVERAREVFPPTATGMASSSLKSKEDEVDDHPCQKLRQRQRRRKAKER